MSRIKGERIEVDSFPKNSEEFLFVALQEYFGEWVCDIRSGILRTDGVRLTRKGITLRAVQLPRLVQALQRALKRLEIKEVKPDDEPQPWEDDEGFPWD